MRFVRTYMQAVVAIATLVGTYVGAKAIDELWLFWVVGILAALIAGAHVIWPKLREAIAKVNAYDTVVEAMARSQERVEALRTEIGELRANHARDVAAGRQWGRQEAAGVIRAALHQAELESAGIAVENGALLLMAKVVTGQVPTIGSIYALRTSLIPIRQGLLRVVSIADDDPAVLLECFHQDVPDFWTELRRRAVLDQKVPDGLVLDLVTVDDLPDPELEIEL